MRGRLAAASVAVATLAWLAVCGPEPPAAASAPAQSSTAGGATARYLANEGVLIVHGETSVVFDPLFRVDFGVYRLLPEEMERALFAGEPPFDGLDAVFISHYHQDHFSPADVLRLLEARPEVRLYAPRQAVAGLVEAAGGRPPAVFDRVHEVALAPEDPPVVIREGALLVEAVRIPHSGWPERNADVENIVWRVTLDDATTVLHLGDADDRDAHYAAHADHWESRRTQMAFPPYWYFETPSGRQILGERLKPAHAVGIHVPVEVPRQPEEREPALRDVDLFTEPGETRDIPDGGSPPQ